VREYSTNRHTLSVVDLSTVNTSVSLRSMKILSCIAENKTIPAEIIDSRSRGSTVGLGTDFVASNNLSSDAPGEAGFIV
jgi:hypothetical protein